MIASRLEVVFRAKTGHALSPLEFQTFRLLVAHLPNVA